MSKAFITEVHDHNWAAILLPVIGWRCNYVQLDGTTCGFTVLVATKPANTMGTYNMSREAIDLFRQTGVPAQM